MVKHKMTYVGSALAMVLGSSILTSIGVYADGEACVSAGGLATEGFVANASEFEYVIQNGIAEIKIAEDFAITCQPTIMTENLKIDLNGKSIVANVPWALDIEAAGKTLTIEDSGDGGRIDFNDAGIWVQDGASLTINSGIINVSAGRGRGIVFRDGTLTLAGGTISANNGVSEVAADGTEYYYPTIIALKDGARPNIVISGTEIIAANGTALSVIDGTVAMTDGRITGGNVGVNLDDGAEFTMSGGDITASTWVVSAYNDTVFTMNGGTITTTGSNSIGVSGNGTADPAKGNYGGNARFNLNGGTITSNDLGVYAPQVGGVTTLGSNLIINATKCGVEVRAGTLNVNGATITVDENTDPIFNPNGNGSTAEGVAVAVAQHTTEQPISVTVNSGVFTAPIAFGESNPQHNDEEAVGQITLAVHGGTFNATNGDPVVASQDVEKFIDGGTFNKEVEAKYVKDDYRANSVANGAAYIVLPISDTAVVDDTDDENTDEIEDELSSVVQDVLGALYNNFYDLVGSDPIEIVSGSGAKFIVADPDAARAALESGRTLITALDGHEIDMDTLDDDEKAELEALLENGMVPLGLLEYWIDLNETDGIGSGSWLGVVTEIPNAIELTYDASGAPEVPEGVTRIWKVIRVHGNTVDVLDAEYDPVTKLVSFATDKFSAFVVTYTDVATSPYTGTMTVMGASAMSASLVTAVVVGVVTSIFSFIVLVRRLCVRKED
ncbi:hypothetical protein IKF88_02205 [Candidatus Saccharibacteria bacterium]|nr:hypothetical protein [Candidatus Saccharibacteria bacterium]